MSSNPENLPLPPHFRADLVDQVRRIDYSSLAQAARFWRTAHSIEPASRDQERTCLLLIDLQNTFCIPGFELFVGGTDGRGAAEDCRRLCEFIYRNLSRLTQVAATLDSHTLFQIFHPDFLVGPDGAPPLPYTRVTSEDIRRQRWTAHPEVSRILGLQPEAVQQYLDHYASSLERGGRFAWTIWPYHAIQGGIGNALVSSIEEALVFHSFCRFSPARIELKGNLRLSEHYSALGPEVRGSPEDEPDLAGRSDLVDFLAGFDRLVVAGEAKSHCVAWTVQDLLDCPRFGMARASSIYLLRDCTSPVVVPGGPDYAEEAEAAFQSFSEAGAHLVESTLPMQDWPEPSSPDD